MFLAVIVTLHPGVHAQAGDGASHWGKGKGKGMGKGEAKGKVMKIHILIC